MFLRAGGVWLLIVPLAIMNGGFREAVLVPWLGHAPAHVASSLLLSVLVLVVASWLIRWIGPRSLAQAVAIGALWLALTVGFEFLAGHYLFGQPWERLLADYNIFQGRVWALVLAATCAAPVLAFQQRGVAASSLSRDEIDTRQPRN
jgi:hypothetical protein